MKKTLLLVIDLGTSFIKTGIYDAEGSCIAIASEPVKDHRPGPGIFIQTRELDVDILVTQDVASRLRARFAMSAMPPMRIKGKADPILTWTIG